MDFWQTVLVLVRRWYITVPAFFATIGIAAAAYFALPVQYESGSVLVITTPLTGGTEATGANRPQSFTNPLLNFDRSVSLTASIVIQQMRSPEIAAELGVTPGAATRFAITNGSSNPELLETGPFLFVQGTGPTPEAAREISGAAGAMAARVLAQRQTDLSAPASTHLTIHEVVPPTTGVPLKGSPQRAAAAAGALACLASLAAVFGLESLMTQRRRRKALPIPQAVALQPRAGAVPVGSVSRGAQ